MCQNTSTNAPSGESRRTSVKRLGTAQTSREAMSTRQESLTVFRDAPDVMKRETTVRRKRQTELESSRSSKRAGDARGREQSGRRNGHN